MDSIEIESDNQQNIIRSTPTLNDVDPDSLLHIFRHLNISDLASVSRVCRLYEDLAEQAFKCERKGRHRVNLRNTSGKCKLEAATILRNFGYHLEKVNIEFGEHNNHQFFESIMNHCSEQLTNVIFFNKCTDVPQNIVLSKENMRRFSAKFVNMKVLWFHGQMGELVAGECIAQNFPALKELCIMGKPFVYDNVVQFINHNPQARHLDVSPRLRPEPKQLKKSESINQQGRNLRKTVYKNYKY